MRKLIYSILFLFISSLSFGQEDQEINKVIVDPDLNKLILIGEVNEKALENTEVFKYNDIYYSMYESDSVIVSKLSGLSEDINIVVVFASWCSDSRRNVPIFKKVVEESGFDKGKIRYFAVNRKKTAGDLDISEYKAEFVPTFIFYRNNEEIGRIVENPASETLEQDWYDIVSK